MTSKTIIIVIVLLALLGLVFWWQEARQPEEKKEAISSVSAFNQTKNQDATQASLGDLIVYTLNVENPNDKVLEGYVVEANILDLQEIANLIDAEGGNYNPTTGSLIWTPLDIPGKGTISKKIRVQVKTEIPANSDMVMRVKFGNEVAVAVIRPAAVAPTPSQPQVAGESSPGSVNYVSPDSGLPLSITLLLAGAMTLGISLFSLARKMD